MRVRIFAIEGTDNIRHRRRKAVSRGNRSEGVRELIP